MTHDHDELSIALVKVGIMWLITLMAHNIDAIIHTVLGIMSIGYLAWKWRRDYKKYKLESNGKSS